MSRDPRPKISDQEGSYHLISRIVGGEYLLEEEEKDYFLQRLELYSQVFYVNIHAYSIMDNHFHILASVNQEDTENASKEELLARYEKLMGKGKHPPEGSYTNNAEVIPDGDKGIERLRRRLGSISCFMQELKQGVSRWYNKKHNRKGYLWSDRFKCIIFFRGEGEFACSAYIDLNPVRAKIVPYPENYRWSSIWLQEHEPERAKSFLTPLPIFETNSDNHESSQETCTYDKYYFSQTLHLVQNGEDPENSRFNLYKEYVYATAGIQYEIKPDQIERIQQIQTFTHALGVLNRLNVRISNFSRGIAIGNEGEIEDYQRKLGRKHVSARKFLAASWAHATRVLRL